MRFEITKEFRFEAAHSLPHLPSWHKCRNKHGHSYGVLVGVVGELDDNGWVMDYARISEAVEPLIKMLDHKDIDEVLKPTVTTAENLAAWFWRSLDSYLPGLSRVEIRETPTSNVIVTR